MNKRQGCGEDYGQLIVPWAATALSCLLQGSHTLGGDPNRWQKPRASAVVALLKLPEPGPGGAPTLPPI